MREDSRAHVGTKDPRGQDSHWHDRDAYHAHRRGISNVALWRRTHFYRKKSQTTRKDLSLQRLAIARACSTIPPYDLAKFQNSFGACVHLDRHAHAAGPAPFDLTGPTLEVTVARGKHDVAHCSGTASGRGRHASIKADFPATQSEHYLLIVAFLRGPTNPPPKDWFFNCATWKRTTARTKGLDRRRSRRCAAGTDLSRAGNWRRFQNARQCRARPPWRIRARLAGSESGNARSLATRALSDCIRRLNAANPGVLKDTTPLLARSLGIRVDEKCLDGFRNCRRPA